MNVCIQALVANQSENILSPIFVLHILKIQTMYSKTVCVTEGRRQILVLTKEQNASVTIFGIIRQNIQVLHLETSF